MRVKQRCIFLGALLAGDDAPVRTAAIDVLPHLFGEFGLLALQRIDLGVGRDVAHHAIVGRGRDAAFERLRLEGGDPLREARIGEGCAGEHRGHAGGAAQRVVNERAPVKRRREGEAVDSGHGRQSSGCRTLYNRRCLVLQVARRYCTGAAAGRVYSSVVERLLRRCRRGVFFGSGLAGSAFFAAGGSAFFDSSAELVCAGFASGTTGG